MQSACRVRPSWPSAKNICPRGRPQTSSYLNYCGRPQGPHPAAVRHHALNGYLTASERHALSNPRLSERSERSLGDKSKGECQLRASERFRHVVCTYMKLYTIRQPLGYNDEHYVYVPLRGTELVTPSIFPRLHSLRSFSLGLLRASPSEAVSHCGSLRMGINPTPTLGDRGLFRLADGKNH